MRRRQFFGWLGKLSAAIGLGYLLGSSIEIDDAAANEVAMPARLENRKMRMSARACHDYRLISNDRSMILDKDIFYI